LVKRGNEVTIALIRLSNYRILEKSMLLLENVDSDGDFYAFILDNHSAFYSCDHLSFECYHGEGYDLPKVLTRLIQDGRIVFAVVDSDRYAPCSKELKVAQLSKISDELNWSLSFSSTPACREIENMIPMNIVLKLPSAVGNSANKIHLAIEEAESALALSDHELFWLYCDLKEGLHPDKLSKLAVDEREWICTKLNFAGIDPKERAISGYGEKVVKQLFADGRLLGELRDLTRHRSWRNVFSSFFEDLAWVFIATPRTRT
jgi:hypothetical protein